MTTISSTQLLDALQWRYATKAFDPARRIPAPTWAALERSLVLSPSSYGLQPYRFLIIADPAKRAALLPHAWGQRQVVDASHLIVFAARTALTRADVEQFIARTAQVRGVPVEALNGYRDMMIGDLVEGPRSGSVPQWAARQAYIALGNLLTSAALLGVDTCPLEGLVPAEFDRILGLTDTGYVTVVACALGYRAVGDKYASAPKVRLDASELVKTL